MQQVIKRVDTEYVDDNTVVDRDRITAVNVVWYIAGTLQTLLLARLILKLFGANPGSGFVQFIYNVTNILTAPFDAIFNTTIADTGAVRVAVFEPSIVVAMVVYAVIAFGISRLLTIDRATPVE